jgi:phospholipase C
MKTFIVKAFCLLVSAVLLASIAEPATAQQSHPLQKVGRVLVILEENRSFDDLLGLFPGPNGIVNARDAAIRVDGNGKPYDHLPLVPNTRTKEPGTEEPILDERFPAGMANAPFLVVPPSAIVGASGWRKSS